MDTVDARGAEAWKRISWILWQDASADYLVISHGTDHAGHLADWWNCSRK